MNRLTRPSDREKTRTDRNGAEIPRNGLGEKSGRAALLARAVEGNSAPRLCLRRGGGVPCDSGVNSCRRRRRKGWQHHDGQRCRRVRALLADRADTLVLRRLLSRHRTLMLPTSATACRKAGFQISCSKERGDKRQQEQQQHRDGEQAAQWSSRFEHTSTRSAQGLSWFCHADRTATASNKPPSNRALSFTAPRNTPAVSGRKGLSS
jgi:hypothetical protein